MSVELCGHLSKHVPSNGNTRYGRDFFVTAKHASHKDTWKVPSTAETLNGYILFMFNHIAPVGLVVAGIKQI